MTEQTFDTPVVHGISCSCCTPVFTPDQPTHTDPNAHNPVPDQGLDPSTSPTQSAPDQGSPQAADPGVPQSSDPSSPGPDPGAGTPSPDPGSGVPDPAAGENLVWVNPDGQKQTVGVAHPDGEGAFYVDVPLAGGGASRLLDTNFDSVADTLFVHGPNGQVAIMRDEHEDGNWRIDEAATAAVSGGSAPAAGGQDATSPATAPATTDAAAPAGSGQGDVGAAPAAGQAGQASEVPPLVTTGDAVHDTVAAAQRQALLVAEQYWHYLEPGKPMPHDANGQLADARAVFVDLLGDVHDPQVVKLIQQNIDTIDSADVRFVQHLSAGLREGGDVIPAGQPGGPNTAQPTDHSTDPGVIPAGQPAGPTTTDHTGDTTTTDPTAADPTSTGVHLADPAGITPWVDTHGDPTGAARVWEPQSINGLCVDNSVKMVIESLTGVHFSEADVEAAAVSIGVQKTNADGTVSGIDANGVEPLIEKMGLDAGTYQHLDMQNLEKLLDLGAQPIVGLDSSDIWRGVPGAGADHAVVVTGIHTDENGTTWVSLNDPGQPTGGGDYTIPWSLFSAAWHAAGDVAIVATGSAAATDQVAKAADLGDPVDAYKQAGLPEPAHAAADAGTGAAPTGAAPTAATGTAPTGAAPAPTGAGLPAGLHPKPGDPGVLRHVEAGGALILIPIALRVLSRLRNK
ncbi:MAG: hypothetical protein M3140_06240 [Actinomycetota bacterium]|nr:hypothetical protein [Actinomycetota bacterium]